MVVWWEKNFNQVTVNDLSEQLDMQNIVFKFWKDKQNDITGEMDLAVKNKLNAIFFQRQVILRYQNINTTFFFSEYNSCVWIILS